ncbi:MAG: glycosyltransferase [Acidobacteria bacterium]|nr:glycosyltransferase [Acidobacteriota bacterium]
MSPTLSLTVPCYNEAARLDAGAFVAALTRHPFLSFLFVDDGSRDDTRRVLADLCARGGERARVLALDANVGKAEAVRRGILHALQGNPQLFGYWDADLATPLEAIPDFLALLGKRPEIDIVLGARVQLLGRQIRRRSTRHYSGRMFATGASLVLGLPVYDTQCGAKIFRACDHTRVAFLRPFRTRWVFDVEILARYLEAYRCTAGGADRIYELSLHCWTDVPGSKLGMTEMLGAGVDLLTLYVRASLARHDPAAVAPQPAAANLRWFGRRS